jgi:hypothetical protein
MKGNVIRRYEGGQNLLLFSFIQLEHCYGFALLCTGKR